MITFESIRELQKSNYIRKASHLQNYWVDFSQKKFAEYKKSFSEFNIIIYSELNSKDHFYVIPHKVLENIFTDEYLVKDKKGRKRWIGTIIDHHLKFSNYGKSINIKDFYTPFPASESPKPKKFTITEDDIIEATNDNPESYQQAARKIRKGQQRLRKNLLIVYQHECCISKTGPENVLQAAHIESHAISGLNITENALLLRSDIHDLFDDNLILIHPETLEVKVHSSLSKTEYQKYHGICLKMRTDNKKPSYEKLKTRWNLANWVKKI
jgi:hypothetical protein